MTNLNNIAKKGIIISKQVEIFMKEDIKKRGR